jgi:ABC-2 type transport system ATP-binding protein
VLFLDEPTTGLDPRSRVDVWAFIRELQREGTTLLLTTQYLEEADQLADRIVVIDLGSVIAEGTSSELKAQIGGEVLELELEDAAQTTAAAEALVGIGSGEPNVDAQGGTIRIPVGDAGSVAALDSTRRLDERKIVLAGFAVHRPTLDDVFMALTGHAAEDGQAPGGDATQKGRRGRKGSRA